MTDRRADTTAAIDRAPHLWGRRDLLTGAAWASVAGTQVVGTIAFMRFLFRRAPVEPPTTFRAGALSEFRPGTVSDRFLRKWRVFIVRDDTSLYAVYAKCTHLGCTPRWYGSDDKFKCPCHGSGFTVAGVNFEGPAPRPLARARIWLGPDGIVRVDVGRRFDAEDWGSEGASLPTGKADLPETTT